MDQVQAFKEILNKFTAKQIEWLVRIILKGKVALKSLKGKLNNDYHLADLKIQCKEETILGAFSEDASNAFKNNKDLKQIADPSYYVTNVKMECVIICLTILTLLCLDSRHTL